MAKETEQETNIQEMLADFRRLLDQRFDRETRRMRRRVSFLGWTAIVLAVVAVAVTGGLAYYAIYRELPAITSPTLRTHELVLVGPDGQERGSWRVDDSGTTRLVLTDQAGVDRLKLTLRPSGEQGVSLADSSGAARVVLGLLDDGSTTLAFADRRGQTRTVLGLAPDESTSLLFADPNGGTRAVMGLEGDGSPTFWWPSLTVEGSTPANGG